MMDTTTRHGPWQALAAGMAITAGALSVPATGPVSADEPYCGIVWGSQREQGRDRAFGYLTGVRAGRHRCFDRMVIDVGPHRRGPNAADQGYSIQYVRQVRSEPSGRRVRLDGGAFINVYVQVPNVVSYDPYEPRYDPAKPRRVVDVTGFRTFRQISYVGDHEGITQFGIGVRARLPFRVFTLPGPGRGSRVVIDVAHRW